MKTPKLYLEQVAEIALYAQEWGVGSEGKDYALGCRETAGHLLSCLMVQNLGLECMDTADGIMLLKGLDNNKHSFNTLQGRMKGYINQLKELDLLAK